MSNYKLYTHQFYNERISALISTVEKLHKTLARQEYVCHPLVKLLARLSKATLTIIPHNPNHRDYLLKGELAKFRRYKRGLQRFRLLFCFANQPALIVYLYVNDTNHLRKDGDKNDPYEEFKALVQKGIFSHNPNDLVMRKWIRQHQPVTSKDQQL